MGKQNGTETAWTHLGAIAQIAILTIALQGCSALRFRQYVVFDDRRPIASDETLVLIDDQRPRIRIVYGDVELRGFRATVLPRIAADTVHSNAFSASMIRIAGSRQARLGDSIRVLIVFDTVAAWRDHSNAQLLQTMDSAANDIRLLTVPGEKIETQRPSGSGILPLSPSDASADIVCAVPFRGSRACLEPGERYLLRIQGPRGESEFPIWVERRNTLTSIALGTSLIALFLAGSTR
jgi:hypothetical protein